MPALAPNAGADRDLNVGTFERLSAVASSRRRLERPDASARRRRAPRQRARSTENEMQDGAKGRQLEEPGQRPKTQGAQSKTKGANDNIKAGSREGRDTSAQTQEQRAQTTIGQAGSPQNLPTEHRTKSSHANNGRG